MNYTWEAALQADRENIKREMLRFVPVRDGSPYVEVVREMINEQKLTGMVVDVNPLYRFALEFSALLDSDLEDFQTLREMLFDIFMQYMVKVDLRQGMSRQEYHLRFMLMDFLKGSGGAQAIKAMYSFTEAELRRLLPLLLRKYRCGTSIYLFRKVMRCLYPGSLVYASNDMIYQVLLYIGVKETNTEREKVTFLRDNFLNVYYDVYLFWDHHFGIIGVEETMEMDDMVLF